MIGKRFTRLVVISNLGVIGNRRSFVWLCRCDCGKLSKVPTDKLNSGHTKSCGCLHRDSARKLLTKHGLKNTPEYSVWKGIKRRCYNKHEKAYPYYGGAGISMSKEWAESFSVFYADMGPRQPGMTIDRIDSKGNYTKENCRWASMEVQQNNRRNNVWIVHNGESKTIAQWSRHIGIPYHTLRDRVAKGWSAEEALNPVLRNSKHTTIYNSFV